MKYNLDEIGVFKNGANFPGNSYGKGIKIINVKDLFKDYFIVYDKLDELKPESLKNPEQYQVTHGDLLFTRSSLVQSGTGMVSMVSQPKELVVFCGFIIRFSPNFHIVNPIYLVYLLRSQSYREMFINLACQTTITNINQKTLGKIEVELPTIEEQNAVATFLDLISNKIRCNNHINKIIEEMVQAIFKSWFIDFEPFQDGEFEDNKFGLIPKGWRVEPIGTLCESISKKHDFQKVKLIFLNTGDIKKGQFLHNTYSGIEGMPGQAKKSIQQNDILFSEIRPINSHFAYVNFNAEDYVVSTKLMVIRTKKINSRRLYHYITSPSLLIELQQEAESRSGTFPQIRFENIKNLPMLLATEDVEIEFSIILESIYSVIDKNILENQRLKELRDTLLPKLMSGEIRVPVQED